MPAPTPAPTPAPIASAANQITALLDGDQALAEKVVAELTSNPLTTFVTLLVKEQEKEKDEADADHRKGEVVIGDQQCRP